MIAEQPIHDQIWTTNVPYERKMNMLSSTDNSFMILFWISVSFFYIFFLLTLYCPIILNP